jgi:hypothetical protein
MVGISVGLVRQWRAAMELYHKKVSETLDKIEVPPEPVYPSTGLDRLFVRLGYN